MNVLNNISPSLNIRPFLYNKVYNTPNFQNSLYSINSEIEGVTEVVIGESPFTVYIYVNRNFFFNAKQQVKDFIINTIRTNVELNKNKIIEECSDLISRSNNVDRDPDILYEDILHSLPDCFIMSSFFTVDNDNMAVICISF